MCGAIVSGLHYVSGECAVRLCQVCTTLVENVPRDCVNLALGNSGCATRSVSGPTHVSGVSSTKQWGRLCSG